MTSTVVEIAKSYQENGRWVVSAAIQTGGERHDLWYKVNEKSLSAGADVFLAASLLPAMVVGGPLYIKGEVSPALLRACGTIQQIFHAWYPKYSKVIHIEAVAGSDQRVKEKIGEGVGCFFSGGVDSFYSALKHQDEITHLIYLQDTFDFTGGTEQSRGNLLEHLRQAATQLNKPLIEIETNIRSFSRHYGEEMWGAYHGSALASAAHLLSACCHKIFISSSHGYDYLEPWGSHPLVDPLWGSEALEIVHDGCEASRPEKVASIASSDVALRWLSVCQKDADGAINCGRCEKCVRTMVNLYLAQALGRANTFPRQLDLNVVSKSIPVLAVAKYHLNENIRAARTSDNNAALVRALREASKASQRRGVAKLIGTIPYRVRSFFGTKALIN